jgi:hypothetical protein
MRLAYTGVRGDLLGGLAVAPSSLPRTYTQYSSIVKSKDLDIKN